MAKVFRVIEISTRHLPPDLRTTLSTVAGMSVDSTHYGWVIWVPDPQHDEVQRPEIRELHEHARRYKCRYIILDAEIDDIDPELHDWGVDE